MVTLLTEKKQFKKNNHSNLLTSHRSGNNASAETATTICKSHFKSVINLINRGKYSTIMNYLANFSLRTFCLAYVSTIAFQSNFPNNELTVRRNLKIF